MRADKLEFNISYSDSAYPDNASKLRVFCYMKNGGYAFGDEFEDKYSATFDSNRTSKYSGYGTITIQLLDAEENLINSANVVCKIIESNSTTPFIASPDFTEQSKFEVQAIVDNGKAQIVEATEEAKAKIDSWTDQSSRIAKNESNISDLQLFKANTGALHFNGGYVKGNSTAFKGIYNSLTVFQTVKIDSIDLSDKQTDRLFSLGLADIEVHNDDLSIGFNSNQVIISVTYSTSKHSDISNRLSIYKYNTEAFNKLNDGKYHTIAVVFQAGNYLKFYIDGNFVYQTDAITPYDLNLSTNAYGYGVGGRPHSTSIQVFKYGEISRSMVFNFNAVLEDAPYTIADYQQGKPIPPKALNGTLLALEDYAITNGNSKIVFDYSGNNNDATITGDVKGDNDNRVQHLIDFITDLS